MLSVEEVDLDTATDFIEYLRPTHARWGLGHAVRWVFRGQADANWKLLPRAWRGHGDSKLSALVSVFENYIKNELEIEHFARRVSVKDSMLPEFITYLAEIASEHDAVSFFAEILDELGIEFPFEAVKGSEFLDRIVSRNEFPDVIVGDGFGIAQHHGIATRLLDWTRKPLIAAYFASQVCKPTSASHIAVWAVDIAYLRSLNESYGIKIITSRRAQNPNLKAQDGLFITCERAGQIRFRDGEWPSLSDIIDQSYRSGDKPMKLIRLPLSKVDTLEWALLRERISLAHLMPTHDNAARLAVSQMIKNANMRIEVTAY